MKLKTAFATLVATMYMASFGVVGATGTLSDTVLFHSMGQAVLPGIH